MECEAYYQLWNIPTGTPKVGHLKVVNRDSQSGTEGVVISFVKSFQQTILLFGTVFFIIFFGMSAQTIILHSVYAWENLTRSKIYY